MDPVPPLSDAASQAAVEASPDSYPMEYVKKIILDLTTYLIDTQASTALFGKQLTPDSYSVSLQTLSTRLQDGHLAPSPLPAHSSEATKVKALSNRRTNKRAENRPLEDFEDLYYAVLAKIQELYQLLSLRLKNGFNSLQEPLCTGGPTIGELTAAISSYWDVLNEPPFVKALDNAIRRSRVKHLHQEIIAQVSAEEITQQNADELLADLYDPGEYDGICGLAWIGGWAPSMIGAWLEEKYRVVLKVEKEAELKKKRDEKRRSKMAKLAEKKAVAEKHTAERQKVEMRREAERMEKARQRQIEFEEKERQKRMDLEWEMKTKRVQQYSDYLRGRASQDAIWLVQNCIDASTRYTSYGRPVQEMDGKDVEMSYGDC